jgi:hypothetical protein
VSSLSLGAPLPGHYWSEDMQDFAKDEEGPLEQGDLRGATILNADFWLENPERRRSPSLDRPEATASVIRSFLRI